MNRSTMRLRLHLSRARTYLEHADGLLQIVHQVRQTGGVMAKCLGTVAALHHVAETFLKFEVGAGSYGGWMRDNGYEIPPSPADKILGQLLAESEPEKRRMLDGEHEEWSWNGGDVVSVFRHGAYDFGPYYRTPEALANLLMPIVWRSHDALFLDMVTTSSLTNLKQNEPSAVSYVTPDSGLIFTPLDDPGSFIGDAPFDLGNLGPRSMFLVGPSGCGKTTLVHLACRARGFRMLKMTARVAMSIAVGSITALVAALKPDVLLIEDMQELLGDCSAYGAMLSWLEHVNGRVTVIGTIMDEREEFAPGDLAFPGMRPGRFDRVAIVRLPCASERRAILAHYLNAAPPEDMTSETDGLSPAYLRALALSLREGGHEHDWRTDLKMLRLMSPRRNRS